MIIVTVTGSRFWDDPRRIGIELDRAAHGEDDVLLRHGKCDPRTLSRRRIPWDAAYVHQHRTGAVLVGADWLAHQHAELREWRIEAFPADWNLYGKAAGGIRNGLMVRQEPHADLVLGFPLPDSVGTFDCLRRARNKGLDVEVIDSAETGKTAQGLW